jgi:hypothetical protein
MGAQAVAMLLKRIEDPGGCNLPEVVMLLTGKPARATSPARG